MTDEKKHVDLSAIEPVVRGQDQEDVDGRPTREDDEGVGAAAAPIAGGPPAVGVLPESDDRPPPDPDELDRLRRR